jgi:REP element-mobilizing transposase RayT
MASTYSKLHYHAVFSTKDRKPTIAPEWSGRLWQYLGGILSGEGAIPIRIGGIADHVHLLFTAYPRQCIATLIQKVKANSSGWIHDEFPNSEFWWQSGYSVFTVSHFSKPAVERYIETQEEHHRGQTYQAELLYILDRHGVEYDEKYLWD